MKKQLGLNRYYNLVEALEALPTIGKKSALKIAYSLIFENQLKALKLSHAIEEAIGEVKKCSRCGGISENELCEICLDEHRNSERLCIVESAKDIFIIEQSESFDGLYFVLDDVQNFDIDKLKDIIDFGVKEIIFALTPCIGSDSIMLFIEDKLDGLDIIFSKIAQGVPTGVHIENIDSLSLKSAISSRVKI